MKQAVSKKDIWRNNTSAFVRFMYGFRIFGLYLSIVIFVLGLCMFLTGIDERSMSYLQVIMIRTQLHMGNKNLLVNIRDYAVMYKMVITAVALLYLFLVALATLWYQFGKSRVMAVLFVIGDFAGFASYIVLLCLSPVFDYVLVIAFVLLLVFMFADFLIMKSIFRYHGALAHEQFKYYDMIRRNAEKRKYPAEYQVSKPKLDITFSNNHDTTEVEEKKINIDEYLDKNAEEPHSIYQKKEKTSKEQSGERESTEQKKKEKSRTVRGQDFVSHTSRKDEKYSMEDRPLLSAIKALKSQEKVNEPEAVQENPDDDSKEIKESELVNESVLESENALQLEEVTDVVEEEIQPEENTDPVEEYKQPEENTDSVEEHKQNDSNGMTVDTSLGYRRITFEDL